MALPSTQGTAHVYGLKGTYSLLTLQSDSLDAKCNVDVFVLDETGRKVTNRMDDVQYDTTLTGILISEGTEPTPGDLIPYKLPNSTAVNYILKDMTSEGSNRDFRKVTLKVEKYSQIAT